MKYWVFDLDGTLTDSFGPYFVILEELLGQTFSRQERKRLIGIHPTEIFKSRLPVDSVSNAIKILQEKSEREANLIPVYNHIRESCSWLVNNGHKLAVWTSRDLVSAKLILQENGIYQFFDHIVSGDCVSKRKPNPEGLAKLQKHFACEPGDILMVGDHDHDMEAAKEFGASAIRASWHNYWDHEVCNHAHRQFYCSSEFYQWLQKPFASASEKYGLEI